MRRLSPERTATLNTDKTSLRNPHHQWRRAFIDAGAPLASIVPAFAKIREELTLLGSDEAIRKDWNGSPRNATRSSARHPSLMTSPMVLKVDLDKREFKSLDFRRLDRLGFLAPFGFAVFRADSAALAFWVGPRRKSASAASLSEKWCIPAYVLHPVGLRRETLLALMPPFSPIARISRIVGTGPALTYLLTKL